MENQELLNLLFEEWTDPLVLVDAGHVIRYMNKSAREKYGRFGDVAGKSIFDCHNENSGKIIREVFDKFKHGRKEVLISSNKTRRVYMTAIYDEAKNLAGYYERFEFLKKAEQN